MVTTLSIDLPDVSIDAIVTTDISIQIEAHSCTRDSCCPDCGQRSSSVHSHYTRQPQDLSCFGQPVQLRLTVTRFRCRNPNCPRVTFVERLPHLVPFYARRTRRLTATMRSIVFETGAEPGARVLAHLGIRTSGDTCCA